MKPILIVAMGRDGTIGRDGGLPWHLRSDLQRFRRMTMGHAIVMGRRTWDSIGRPLPGRRSIVLSRDPSLKIEGAEVVDSIEAALGAAGNESPAFVIGGAEIFRAFLPAVDELRVTWVEGEVTGETRFPDWNPEDWSAVETEPLPAGPDDEFPTTYVRYLRKPAR